MTQATKTKATNNVGGNTFMDKVWMGGAAAFFLFAGYVFIFEHVKATEPLNYILAGVGTVFILYTLLAPFFRGK